LCALRDASVRCEALDIFLVYRFAGSPKSSFAHVPLRRCVSRCRVSASVRRPGAPRQPRAALASATCAAPGENTHPGCGTELAILPDSDPNLGLVDSRQRRWETSPRDVAKLPKDLEGDPSPGRTGSGCAFNRAARFQTPTGSKATKSSKRHGGQGCSDATRLWRRKILRGVRTCIAGKAIVLETR